MAQQKSVYDVLKNLLDFIENNNVTDVHKISPWLTNVEDVHDGTEGDYCDEHTDERSTEFTKRVEEAKKVLESLRHLH